MQLYICQDVLWLDVVVVAAAAAAVLVVVVVVEFLSDISSSENRQHFKLFSFAIK